MNLWRGRKVLITGHTGFKGSWLTQLLMKLGADVYGFSLEDAREQSLYKLSNLDLVLKGECFGDIRDPEALSLFFKRVNPEVVFHLAAIATVQEAADSPRDAISTNVMGTFNVLNQAVSSGARVVIAATTDKVYKNREWLWPYRESERLGGTEPYSASKTAAENVITMMQLDSGDSVITAVRAGNVIGGGDAHKSRLIPDLADSWLNDQVVALRMPFATRPWQHVLDCLRGYVLTAERSLLGVELPPALNFGPTGSMTVLETSETFFQALGAKLSWTTSNLTGKEHYKLELDSNLALSVVGWKPLLSMHEAVTQSARWYGGLASGSSVTELVARDMDSFLRLDSLADASLERSDYL